MTAFTQAPTDRAVSSDSGNVGAVLGVQSAGLVDVLVITRGSVATDAGGLTDAGVVFGSAASVSYTAGLTDSATTTLTANLTSKSATDPIGPSDTGVRFGTGVTVANRLGISDAGTVYGRAGSTTDAVATTDIGSSADYDEVDTDALGVTDALAFTRAPAVTDTAGVTDGLVFIRALVVTDATGITDVLTLERALVVTDTSGSIDVAATMAGFAVVVTDIAGLLDTTQNDSITPGRPPGVPVLHAVLTLTNVQHTLDLAGAT